MVCASTGSVRWGIRSSLSSVTVWGCGQQHVRERWGKPEMGISTHVLDTSLGRPARGVPVILEFHEPLSSWQVIGKGMTHVDGRLKEWLSPDLQLKPGDYRITLETGTYFTASGVEAFYPEALLTFTIRNAAQPYHIPSLPIPFVH